MREDWTTTESDDIVDVPFLKQFLCAFGFVRCMALKCTEYHFVKWHVQLLYVPFFVVWLAIESFLFCLLYLFPHVLCNGNYYTRCWASRNLFIVTQTTEIKSCHRHTRKKKHALVAFFSVQPITTMWFWRKKKIYSDDKFIHQCSFQHISLDFTVVLRCKQGFFFALDNKEPFITKTNHFVTFIEKNAHVKDKMLSRQSASAKQV